MPRRPKDFSEDLELDSLMDAMTNVVGVLILVLLMVQMNVQETVKHIIQNSTVTQKDVDEAKEKLARLTENKDLLTVQLDSFNIASEQERLNRLKDTIAARKKLLADTEKEANKFAMKIESDKKMAETSMKEIELAEAEREKLQASITEALAKKADLQARLDKTPVKAAPPPKILSIPNPRPAPPNAKRLNMLCANGKLYPMSVDDFRKDAENRGKQIIIRYKLNTDPQAGINPEEFAKHFLKMPSYDDDFFTAEYFINDNRWPRLRMIPREDRGFPAEAITSNRSPIKRLLLSINPQQFYVVFYVLPDSYDVYLTARQVLMQNGVQAGWEAQPQNWIYETSVPVIELGPPRPKPPAPTTPQPPAKPANVLD